MKLLNAASFILPFAFAVEAPKTVEVPDICGFVSVQVCVAARSHIKIARIIHVRPSSITALANPEDSPKGCIRLYIGTRTIYVVGDYDDVADRIHKAQTEIDEHKCGEKIPEIP